MSLISCTSMVDMRHNFQKNNMQEYILGTGEEGAENLDLQHEIFKNESYLQLKNAGLKKDMIVWDIGCGNGAMTENLAKELGGGRIYAIDNSEEQIKVAKARIKTAGYSNVTFIIGDISDINCEQYNKADIVYARFLLMHVYHPKKIIALMSSLLKPGGVLVLQESSMLLSSKDNASPIIKKYYDLIIKYGKEKGFDYNIGVRLPEMCDDLGVFRRVNSYVRDYPTTNSIKDLLYSRVEELKQKIISAKLSTEEEYLKLKLDLRSFFDSDASNSSLVMCRQAYILAYK